jgi:hypothetical protein
LIISLLVMLLGGEPGFGQQGAASALSELAEQGAPQLHITKT